MSLYWMVHVWPDYDYERTYWVNRNGEDALVARYRNESADGVTEDPLVVGQFVVILTSAKVYRLDLNNRVQEFSPSMTDQWRKFAEPHDINSHHDYRADAVELAGGAWGLSYVRKSPEHAVPRALHFVTRDDWRSFQIEGVEDE